jgi:arabinogalactan endo-1,4-beta-galactosidase
MKQALIGVLTLMLVFSATAGHAMAHDPFIIGADISWVPEDEAAGAAHYDRGVKKDIFDILKEYKFNSIRLRIFVNPSAPGGYSRQGFCDLEHTKAMAKRIQAAGMSFWLDFHYSDTWADPEHQNKPLAWRNFSVEQLEHAVADHTMTVLKALEEQGTPPAMIQIGNEVTHGMLWPEGRVWSQIPSGNTQTDARTATLGPGLGNYDNFARFLMAGINAAHVVDPKIRIVLHNHLARNGPRMVEWMDELLKRGVAFDIIGMSAYAQEKEGDWQNTFAILAKKYPDHQQLVMEYSAQKIYLNDLVFQTPSELGLGAFIWEPTRHREALFNRNGVNAGGGQASNFVNDIGVNQGANGTVVGAATRTATLLPVGADSAVDAVVAAPTASSTATAPARGRGRGSRNGGRYDTNDLFLLYPQMSREYAK